MIPEQLAVLFSKKDRRSEIQKKTLKNFESVG